MSRSLSNADVAAYHERGYHFPLRVFSAAEMAGIYDRFRATEAKVGGRLEGRMNQKPHLLFPWLDELVRHPRILDAVEDVLGPNILCWSCAVLHEAAPATAAFVSWHQDATYWGLSLARRRHRLGRLHAERAARAAACASSPARTAARSPHTDTFDDEQPAVARPGDRGRGRRERRPSTSCCSRARCRCTTC